MSSRALLRIDCEDATVINMIRDFGAEPEFFGRELSDFLARVRVREGRSPIPTMPEANGVGNLLAQLVAYFVGKPGHISLAPLGFTNCDQDWEYRISYRHEFDVWPTVEVFRGDDEVFHGDLASFGTFCRTS